MATAEAERSSNLRKGSVKLPGLDAPIETAIHEIRAGGQAKFIASEINNIGMDDALAAHDRAMGLPEHIPIAKRIAAKIDAGKMVPRASDGLVHTAPAAGVAPAVALPPVPGSPEELAAQLKPFADDPEMQDVILKRWQGRRDAIAEEALAKAETMTKRAPAKTEKVA